MNRWVIVIAMIVSSLGLATPGQAQDGEPDAILRLSQTSVALGFGYTWGDGSLSYRNQTYRVDAAGISVVALGVATAHATGEVFNLKRVEDFAGTYTAMTFEGTLASGAGSTIMRNPNGVVIKLFTTTEGLNFKLAPEGIKLSIK